MEPTECSIQDALNITEDEALQLLYNSMDKVILGVILPIILGLSILFTCIFLFVVFRVSEVRSDTTIYLIHLALADLLYIVSSSCFYILPFIRSPVKLLKHFNHPAGCWISALSTLTGYFTSIALVTMMSYERFLAVCHPLKHLHIRGRRRTLKTVAFCWLIGLIWAVLEIPQTAILRTLCVRWPTGDTYQMFPSALTFCTLINPWLYYFTLGLGIVPWLVSMFSNVYMYVRIILVLHKRRGVGGRQETDRKALQIRNQVAKMLIANGVVFFICQAPYVAVILSIWLCRLAQIYNPLEEFLGKGGEWVFRLPLFINSIVNPVIYGLTNRQYRDAFVQAFHPKAPVNGKRRVLRSVHAINNPRTNATQASGTTGESDMDTESMKGTRL